MIFWLESGLKTLIGTDVKMIKFISGLLLGGLLGIFTMALIVSGKDA